MPRTRPAADVMPDMLYGKRYDESAVFLSGGHR